MPNGYGRGGWGFGFRGSSPPWPFVGIGRGGLPRCGYFLSGVAGMPMAPGYLPYGAPWAMPYRGIPYGSPAYPGADPYSPQMAREQELEFLKNQAEAIRGQLEQIDARISELEAE